MNVVLNVFRIKKLKLILNYQLIAKKYNVKLEKQSRKFRSVYPILRKSISKIQKSWSSF